MRLLRRIIKNNWKYIFTELVLIFVGIYLALSLNNWNESQKVKREKNSVIAKLEEEVQANLQIMTNAEERNTKFFKAMERFGDLSGNDATEIIATEAEFEQLMKEHADYFAFESKKTLDSDRFQYDLSLQINFSDTDLRDIAWSTAKTAGFAREFNYNCLLSIEDVYRDQAVYLKQIREILPIIIDGEHSRLPITSSLVRQYGANLIQSYEGSVAYFEGLQVVFKDTFLAKIH